MKLVLLTHPPALVTVSQPRFAEMIRRGLVERGHTVELWTSASLLARRSVPSAFLRKWLGYADQFVLYPRELRRRIREQPADTVFVVTDQALGMWVPHLAHRPHVIHCHDFLALRSALGEFPEHPTGWTGRQYQRLIRKGFSQGRAFISVSQKTREELHRFLAQSPTGPRTSQRGCPYLSEVVHNGLNHPFRPMELAERMPLLKKTGVAISEPGFIVHVGGNQWYKNRQGVLAVYRAYAAARFFHKPGPLNPTFSPGGGEGVRRTDEGGRGLQARNSVLENSQPPELWLIGSAPTAELRGLAAAIPAPGRVHFLSGLDNDQVNAAYAHAKALLFPSLEEGFGWPIVEAMASGCPVITTAAAPMTEVAGDAARLIPRMPAAAPGGEQQAWAQNAASVVAEVVQMRGAPRADLVRRGWQNARRFDTAKTLDAYARIYQQVLAAWTKEH